MAWKNLYKLGDKKSAQKFFVYRRTMITPFMAAFSREVEDKPSPRYVTKKDSKGFKINNQKDLVEVAASLYFAERGFCLTIYLDIWLRTYQSKKDISFVICFKMLDL